MAEQTFRSPGFFEREIDASQRQTEIVGVPAGIVGTAEKGPAFIPVTVGSMTDFVNKFGIYCSNKRSNKNLIEVCFFYFFPIPAFRSNGN